MRYNKKHTTAVYTTDDAVRFRFGALYGPGSVPPPVWCKLTSKDTLTPPGRRCDRIIHVWRALGAGGYVMHHEPPAGVEQKFVMNSNMCESVRLHAAFCCGCAMKSGYNTAVMAKVRRAAAEIEVHRVRRTAMDIINNKRTGQ